MQLTWTQLGVNYQVKMQRKAQQNKEQKMHGRDNTEKRWLCAIAIIIQWLL